MKDNRVKFENDAVALLKSGVDKLANAVKSTLGPSGKNVIIIESNGKPVITKDGVSVAKAVDLDNPFENAGAHIIQEVAAKTLKNVGDNTTTATVLAQSLINNGLEVVNRKSLFDRLLKRSNGSKVVNMKKGIDFAVSVITKEIKKQSIKVKKGSDRLLQIATVSANNDKSVGEVVFDALNKVTEDGVINIEICDNTTTEIEYTDGVQIDSGYISEDFMNDKANRICVLDNCYILYYYGGLTTTKLLVRAMEHALSCNCKLLVVAKDIYGEALQTMRYNASNCCGIKIDGSGIFKRYNMDDLAVVTGGRVFEENEIFESPADLGFCKRVVIKDENTIFFEGNGDEKIIEEKAASVRQQVKDISDNEIKDIYKKRLARIKGGVVTIKVGGYTDIEKKEKYDRFDDSVCATRAALKEGIVVGGGMAYIKCIYALMEARASHKEYKDAINVVINAIQEPFRQIVRNCGEDDNDKLIDAINAGNNYGYNGITNKIENMFESGIIDASMAVRVAIENAASIAGLFLTTSCIVNNYEQGAFIQ